MSLQIQIDHGAAWVVEQLENAGYEAYVVGGCVRDALMGITPKDWDITTSARPEQVKEVFSVTFDTGIEHGTVSVRYEHETYEVTTYRIDGAYTDHRRPDAVAFTSLLYEDLARRDFTINALAVCLNGNRFGELVDRFDGLADMQDRIIATPLDPDVTFSDDPLRMMRCIRFATQLRMCIEDETQQALERNAQRISIISQERIVDELNKIMLSPVPSLGFIELARCGLLPLVMPEVAALEGVEVRGGRAHTDNLYHSLEVLDNVARVTADWPDEPDEEKAETFSHKLWLRWAALLHDIGKPRSKRWEQGIGWTFHNHNYLGEKMIPGLFRRMKLPMDERMKYVQRLVGLHMRPIAIADDEVTDSAVRRLLFEAGEDIDDLMLLCEADITSRNQQRKQRFLDNFRMVREKLSDLQARESYRTWTNPITGEEIMQTFGIEPCKIIGELKQMVKDAIWDSQIPNTHEAAREYMLKCAAGKGLYPVNTENKTE